MCQVGNIKKRNLRLKWGNIWYFTHKKTAGAGDPAARRTSFLGFFR